MRQQGLVKLRECLLTALLAPLSFQQHTMPCCTQSEKHITDIYQHTLQHHYLDKGSLHYRSGQKRFFLFAIGLRTFGYVFAFLISNFWNYPILNTLRLLYKTFPFEVDGVLLYGVIISRQQMRWKFLMVLRKNHLQLFSKLFLCFRQVVRMFDLVLDVFVGEPA